MPLPPRSLGVLSWVQLRDGESTRVGKHLVVDTGANYNTFAAKHICILRARHSFLPACPEWRYRSSGMRRRRRAATNPMNKYKLEALLTNSELINAIMARL